MKEIRSEDVHGGWSFSVSSSGIRGAIKNALATEFHAPHDAVELSALRLLTTPEKTFVFRARIGVRVIVGTAKVDIAVYQSKVGEEFASSFVCVSYGGGSSPSGTYREQVG